MADNLTRRVAAMLTGQQLPPSAEDIQAKYQAYVQQSQAQGQQPMPIQQWQQRQAPQATVGVRG